jgi:hypothetical protein
MVQILSRKPVTVFRVFDRDGRAIGQVVQPRSAPVVGVGARTVLLVRGEGETGLSLGRA